MKEKESPCENIPAECEARALQTWRPTSRIPKQSLTPPDYVGQFAHTRRRSRPDYGHSAAEFLRLPDIIRKGR
jgi:hypothetical protein